MASKGLTLLFALLCVSYLALAEDGKAPAVRDVTEAEFEKMNKDAGVLVVFYAPWCGKSKVFNNYELLLVDWAFKGTKVKVVRIDAEKEKKLVKKHKIPSQFPGVYAFKKGGKKAERYDGTELVASEICKWAAKALSVRHVSSSVNMLTSANIAQAVMDSNQSTFVLFYEGASESSRNIAQMYEDAALTFKDESEVTMCKIDVQKHNVKDAYDVTAVPSIMYFSRTIETEQDGIQYTDALEGDAVVDFVNRRAKTLRVLGGGLNDKGGRIRKMDAFASRFMKDASKRAAVIAEATKSVDAMDGKQSKSAAFYVKVMQDVQEKGESFIPAEIARVEKQFSTQAPNKPKGVFYKIRLNILNAFVAKANENTEDEEEVSDAGIRSLTDANFPKWVDGSRGVLVEFCVEWDGHCKNFFPKYEAAAAQLKEQASELRIARIDVDIYEEIARKFEVKKYPTVLFFPKNNKAPVRFTGRFSTEEVVNFAKNQLGQTSLGRDIVQEFTPDSFNSVVLDEGTDALVEFYAPWCGHCKKIAPAYNQLAITFKSEPSVAIGKVDATKYQKLATKYDVKGYPTILFFSRDSKTPIPYEGERDAESMVAWMNDKAKTQSLLGGWHNQPGRLVEFDRLADNFMSSDRSRPSIMGDAQRMTDELEGEHALAGKFYVLSMKRILEKGDDFVSTEQDRLEKLIGSNSVRKEKIHEFNMRRNILNAFNAM